MFQHRRQKKTQTFAPHQPTFRPSQNFLRPEQSPLVQAKLQVGIAGDCYEKEVERVADQNMRSEMIPINDVFPTDIQRPGSVAQDLQHLTEVEELLQLKKQNSYNNHSPRHIPVVKIPSKKYWQRHIRTLERTGCIRSPENKPRPHHLRIVNVHQCRRCADEVFKLYECYVYRPKTKQIRCW